MDYDIIYSLNDNYFGYEPERILRNYYHLINVKKPVLDIGAGQGRNSVFLGREGYTVHALEPSRIGTNAVYEIARLEHLAIKVINNDFKSFEAPTGYSGILIFGLLQSLSWSDINLLAEKAGQWSQSGSLLFITAFSPADPAFSEKARLLKNVGRNSFIDSHERYFTYFEAQEILDLFPHEEVIYQWTGAGPVHRHGEGPFHQHGLVQLVLRR